MWLASKFHDRLTYSAGTCLPKLQETMVEISRDEIKDAGKEAQPLAARPHRFPWRRLSGPLPPTRLEWIAALAERGNPKILAPLAKIGDHEVPAFGSKVSELPRGEELVRAEDGPSVLGQSKSCGPKISKEPVVALSGPSPEHCFWEGS